MPSRLKEYPKLTAVRLFKEVRAAGYPGSYNQVKRYVRKVRPRPPEEPVVRFETAPGRQGQVDFAHFRLPWGERYALIVVLGYSRLLWVQFYTRQTMKALMHGLESSFSYFGGVPRELLFDQMKAVVIEYGRYDDGALVENPEFMRYAYHWNFRIRACRPYRAQTKGKVERPIRYLRESFFYGRTFTSDDDLNAQALHWLETEANVRSHATLKERPLDRFECERLELTRFSGHFQSEVSRRSPRCQVHMRRTRRSFGGRSSIWCGQGGQLRSWRRSSSPRLERSGTGSSRQT